MQITVPNRKATPRFRPDPIKAPPPWPVVVLAHGGGWIGGGPGTPSQRKLAQDLATAGVICVSAAYRPTIRFNGTVWKGWQKDPESAPFKEIRAAGRFPGALRDLKAAVRRARREIKEGLLKEVADRNDLRVGVCGTSAGAHLMSMVALTDGELKDLDLGEERATNTLQSEWIPRPMRLTPRTLRERRRLITESLDRDTLGDLSEHSPAADFVAPIACPHPDLDMQIRVGKARTRPGERKPGVFSLTENEDEDLIRDASPVTYLVGEREMPEFLFFHAKSDVVCSFRGVDSEAKGRLGLPAWFVRRLRRNDLGEDKAIDLGPGFRQLIREADGRSELLDLGKVTHGGWKDGRRRRRIAEEIANLARNGLSAVDLRLQPNGRSG